MSSDKLRRSKPPRSRSKSKMVPINRLNDSRYKPPSYDRDNYDKYKKPPLYKKKKVSKNKKKRKKKK